MCHSIIYCEINLCTVTPICSLQVLWQGQHHGQQTQSGILTVTHDPLFKQCDKPDVYSEVESEDNSYREITTSEPESYNTSNEEDEARLQMLIEGTSHVHQSSFMPKTLQKGDKDLYQTNDGSEG